MGRKPKRDQSGPRGRTPKGTQLEVVKYLGCGDLLVRPLHWDSIGVCNVELINPETPEDGRRITAMLAAA